MPLKLIGREQWGALPPRKPLVPMKHPILYVCFTYVELKDVDDLEIVRKVQKHHMDTKSCDDVESSFIIGRDGIVYEGRGWWKQPEPQDPEAEAGNYLEVGFISQVKGKKDDDPMVVAMIDLLEYGVNKGFLDEDYAMFSDKKEYGLGCDNDSDSSVESMDL